MADNKDPKSVNTASEAPMNSIYGTAANAITESFTSGIQSAHKQAGKKSASVVGHKAQEKIFEEHYAQAKNRSSALLKTYESPNRVQSEVASLAHQEATRKQLLGSQKHLTGQSDLMLEQGYQEDMVRSREFRQQATNAMKVAQIDSRGKPILGAAYLEAIASGDKYTQSAALKKGAMNQKRSRGTSDVKIESAIQEMESRHASFTEDEDLKQQIKENKISRKVLQSNYKANYKEAQATKTTRLDQQAQMEELSSQKSLKTAAFENAIAGRRAVGDNRTTDELVADDTSLQAARKEIEEITESLIKLGDSAVATDEKIQGYNDSLAKQERLIKSMPKDGMAGFMQGGGGDAMIEAMGTAAQMYRRHAVGVPMREEKAKGGIANLALSRYNKQYAATQGDMASYYEIVQDAGGAEAFGKEMGFRSQASNIVEGTLDVATGGIDVANLALGGGSAQGVDKGLAVGAKLTAAAVKGIAGGARAIDEHAVIGAETKLEAILTKDQYNSAIAAMRSQGGQALYDQSMGAANVSIGSGNAKALEEKLSSIGGMQDALTRGNLSPQEFMQVTAQVGQSVYGANHDRGEIAIKAGEIQKKRVMTTDQYTQAMGIQSAAGGSVGGLESTLKRAVAAGVNDSKLLVEFVQLSANLNQSLTDMGVSAENHTAYQNKVQQMREAGVSEVLATRSAASQIGKVDEMLTDTTMNEGSLIRSAMARDIAGPNATDAQRYFLQTADTAQLNLLTKKDLTADEQNSLKMLPPEIGALRDQVQSDPEKNIAKIEAMIQKVIEYAAGTAQVYSSGDPNKAAMTSLITKTSFRPEGENIVSMTSGKEKDFKSQAGTAEDRKLDQGQAALNQIEQAAKALGGVKETFDAITASIKVITANLDANAQANKAEEDAKNLDPSGKFQAATTQFAEAVKEMRTKMGMDPISNASNANVSKQNWSKENTGGKMGNKGKTGTF